MTYPDISFVIGELSKFMQAPGLEHTDAIKYVFRYLSGASNGGLTYSSGRPDTLVGWSDADWNNNLKSGISVSGLRSPFTALV